MKTSFILVIITSLVTTLSFAAVTTAPFDLTTKLGEKFKNCRVTKITPEGLTVVHDGGVARLSFSVLDEELRKYFNYDPVKAREYAAAEQAKAKVAEEKRMELNRQREMNEEDQLAALAAAERKRLQADARATKEYQDAIKAAQTPTAPLAPLPGDPTPSLSPGSTAPVMQTEVVVPELAPIGDPYSPTKIRSQTYILPNGYVGGYAPYGGYGYGYGYGYGGYYQPVYSHPGCAVPYGSLGVHGTITTGGLMIQVNH